MNYCCSKTGSCYHKMGIAHERMIEIKNKIDNILTNLNTIEKKDYMRTKIRYSIIQTVGDTQRNKYFFSVGDGAGINYY